MMFDLEQLRQLVAIEETGSLSAAGEKLHLSQPALSRSMQRLEAELGFTLFERSRNRLVFNELGLHAVEGARRLLRGVQFYRDDLRDYAARLFILRIGACTPAPLWRLSTEIHERFPQYTVAEEQHDAAELLDGLWEGRFRLILTLEPVAEAGILCRRYAEERMVLELPHDHPLCDAGTLTIEDLKGLTVLSYRNIGVWRERLEKIGGLHVIEQTELDVLEDLARSSGLPMLKSSLALLPATGQSGRVSLPVLGEAAVLPLYLCARESDRELFEQLC